MFGSPGTRARQASFYGVLLRRLTRQGVANPNDGVEVFARRRGGRDMAAQIAPVGLPYEFQPYLGGNKVALSIAVANSTIPTTIGWQSPTSNGTSSARSLSTTSLFSSMRRIGYVPASAAINLVTGWNANGNSALFWRGNAAGRGGFFFHARFGFAALTSGNRHMIGLSASVTTSADPSSALNTCFIGKDAADTNFQAMHNDGSGTCTKVDTGIVPTADKLYDAFIFAQPNGSSIKLSLVSYDDTGAMDQFYEYEAVTDLPVTTTFMIPRVLSGSGTATTGAQIDILQLYTEVDNS